MYMSNHLLCLLHVATTTHVQASLYYWDREGSINHNEAISKLIQKTILRLYYVGNSHTIEATGGMEGMVETGRHHKWITLRTTNLGTNFHYKMYQRVLNFQINRLLI